MKKELAAFTIVFFSLAYCADADVIPVRSSVDSSASVSLNVVDLTDEETNSSDQGAAIDSLGPVLAEAMLSTSDGVFNSSSSGSLTFVSATQGSITASNGFSGVQTAKDPDAQGLSVTLGTVVQYDFSTDNPGSVNLSGTLFNGGTSPVSYYTNVRFIKETTPGAGFIGSGTEHQVLDLARDGELFDFTMPLDSPTGNYRIEVAFPHSSVGPLEAPASGGTLDMTFTISVDACEADFNSDGTLDVFDVFAFLDAFNAGDLAADFTDDGSLDIFDVFAFLDAFKAGCP